MTGHDPGRVAPFGNPRINACLPLPEAYRSLPRPSSPADAKASIVRPFALDQETRSSRYELLALSYEVVKDQTRLRGKSESQNRKLSFTLNLQC